MLKAVRHGKIYALKTLLSKPGLDFAAQLRLFQEEWAVMRNINHPRIPQCFDFFQLGDTHFLVQEFMPGTPLSTLIQGGYLFCESEIRHIVMQLLAILADLHTQGIVHRDLRLSNLILHQGALSVVDFGFARNFTVSRDQQHFLPSDPPKTGASSSYLALRRAVSPVSDLFAVGLVAVDLSANWPDDEISPHHRSTSPFYRKFVKTLLQAPDSIASAQAALEMLRSMP